MRCEICNKKTDEEKIQKESSKKIIALCILFITIVCITFLNPYFLEYQFEKKIKTSVSNYLNNNSNIVEDYSFSDDNINDLKIILNDSFERIEYNKKLEYLKNLSSFNLLSYIHNDLTTLEIRKHPNFNINIKCYTSNHEYYYLNSVLYRDNTKYSEIDAKLDTYFILIQQKYSEDSTEIIDMLESMKNIEDIVSFCEEASSGDYFGEEIIYKYSTICMENYNFEVAKNSFNKIINYKDSKQLIDKCDLYKKYVGTWDYGNGTLKIVIAYNELYNVIPLNTSSLISTYEYKIENEVLKTSLATYEIFNDKLIVTFTKDKNNVKEYVKVNDDHSKPESQQYQEQKKEPEIGMTASEVRASTWGNPNKINKTTTVYGTSEQWCYSNYRYIYLDDGYVTAIQE